MIIHYSNPIDNINVLSLEIAFPPLVSAKSWLCKQLKSQALRQTAPCFDLIFPAFLSDWV